MALDRALVPISFGQGIDTKTDPKQQILTTFRKAKNVVYETIYSVRKRFGYAGIQLITTTNTQVNDAQQVTAFKNELGVLTDNTYYSFSPTAQKLAEKGPIYKVFSETTPVINHSFSVVATDTAYIEGLIVTVYANNNFEVRYSVQDAANNSFLVSNDLVTSNGEKPRIAYVGGTVFLFFANLAGQVRYRKFDISTPSTLSGNIVLVNDLHVLTNTFDAQSSNGLIFLAYNSTDVGARVQVVSIDANGTITQTLGISGSPSTSALTVYIDSSYRVVVVYGTLYSVTNYNLTGFLCINAATGIGSASGNTGIIEVGAGLYKVFSEDGLKVLNDVHINTSTVDTIGTVVVASAQFIRGVGLAAQPYKIDGAVFVPTVSISEVQSSYFILDENAKVVCRFLTGQGQSQFITFALPHVAQINDSQVIVPTTYKTRFEVENLTFFSVFGAASTRVSHEPATPLQTATLGENLHIAGGVLRAYDGDEIVEHGYHMYPEELSLVSSAAGALVNGDYFYQAVYKWTDNYGQEHRSAPSPDLKVTVSGGSKQLTIRIPTLKITDKTEVQIELYRTEVNASGGVAYLTGTVLNDPTIDNVTITDNTPDASLIEELPLYTTGGVLDNGPAPSGRVVGVHTASNRLFMATDDGLSLFYSKIRQQGQPVEWNEALVRALDPIGGKVTALASMDEKIVVFKEDAIFFIAGSGPNNLGEQDNFTDPERVSVEVGCIEPQSVVLTNDGLMFKSRKGIYLLSRSMGLDYVGSSVEEYNNLQITSAELIGKYNQIRFTTKTGECLVYNYYLKLWSTFDNHAALSAKAIGNDYYYVRSSNQLFKEAANTYSDNGSPIAIFIETGWMSFAKLQGFQRAYKMLVLGDWKSAHNLRVRAAYDFNNAWVNEKVLNPVPDVVSGLAYGDSSPYGSESPYGGDGNVYQARFDFKKQKCQSVKLQFQEQQSVAGEGLSLSAFTLEIGGKRGLFKPRQSKIKGLR